MTATTVEPVASFPAPPTLAVAAFRGGPSRAGGVALGALCGAIGVASLVGTPTQYLAYAYGLVCAALIPGLMLALGRAR
ncbi:MAG: hypothetical protein B7Y86_12185 [Brevundimonas subvibrioides]|uniref:Uncharacterized protein n=1 Tax=Brevundimonas subvibrioides TaxID=74313 RepID=A0A258HFL2_9CAUL|nr:hypothetical protein [Brevundimonas subvibrioides]OYX55706.1 MAG: hypothetical protein B7Y86_12185 [Brevundimonas subvibrioides]